MDDIVLVGALIEISRGAYLFPETKFVFLQILVHVVRNGGRDVFAEKIKGFLAFSGDLVACAAVAGLLVNQSRLLQLI